MGICIKEVETMRKQGKSIKAIARHFHCSDKKIAAIVKPMDEKKKSEMEFQRFVNLACERADCATSHFVEQFNKGVLSQMEDILKGKKTSPKEVERMTYKILDENFDAFQDAALVMGIAALWTMPAKFKKLWLDNIATEPKDLTSKK